MFNHFCRCLSVLAVVPPVLSASVALAAPGPTLDVWTRTAGPAAGADKRTNPRVIDLSKLPVVEVRRTDVQYGRVLEYRGVPLQAVLDEYAPAAALDLALLHFGNGMQVPLPFRDAALVKSFDLFVAIATRPSSEANWRTSFPALSRPRSGFADARPIKFGAIKLVSASAGHPALAPEARGVLAPWQHTDSLTGVELVSSQAYFAQFNVGDEPAVQHGQKLFMQNCQFCHGARQVGAAFGWDFVDPTPIYNYRGRRNLFYHVKYKPIDASARGLQMPAMSHMSEPDVADLWQWLRAVATRPMPAYAP